MGAVGNGLRVVACLFHVIAAESVIGPSSLQEGYDLSPRRASAPVSSKSKVVHRRAIGNTGTLLDDNRIFRVRAAHFNRYCHHRNQTRSGGA